MCVAQRLCFPPARGTYFPTKCGQNTAMEGFLTKGWSSWEPGPGLRFLACLDIFLNINFMLIFWGLRSHFGRFLASKSKILAPKSHPKPVKNCLKIDVPKNVHLFDAFLLCFSFFPIFDFLKICVLPR